MYYVGISLVIYEGIMGGCALYIFFFKEHMEGIVWFRVRVRVLGLESIRIRVRGKIRVRVRARVVINVNLGITDVQVTRLREIYLMGVSSDCALYYLVVNHLLCTYIHKRGCFTEIVSAPI